MASFTACTKVCVPTTVVTALASNAAMCGNSLLGANADPTYRDQLNECFLRMTIRTQERKVADAYGRLFPWLGLSGPPYVGSMKGVQGAKELLGIWPALVKRELVESKTEIAVEKV